MLLLPSPVNTLILSSTRFTLNNMNVGYSVLLHSFANDGQQTFATQVTHLTLNRWTLQIVLTRISLPLSVLFFLLSQTLHKSTIRSMTIPIYARVRTFFRHIDVNQRHNYHPLEPPSRTQERGRQKWIDSLRESFEID